MNFNNDNSTQLNIGTATYTPSYSSKTAPNIILNDGTSGIYNPSINNIRLFTNNIDALTIDSNQCLYGNATGLTNLGYVNIINKPTNFQSDWNSTVINKPTNFQSDWNSTVINKPSTFAADMTNIYTKTEVNNITTLTNYYNKTSTDTLLTGKEAVLTFLLPLTRTSNTISIDLSLYLTSATASTTYATITNLNAKENTLTFSAPLTRTTNTISIDLSSYLTSATASTTYQPILTFSSPMTKTGANVTIDLSTYDTISARNTALSSYLTSATASTTYLKLDGTNSMVGSLNITSSGTNSLIFDNVFNNNKIKLNSTNGIGVDSSGVLICSSDAVRFANSTGSTINATITAAGDFSFLGTVYSGAVSTGGTVYATGMITGGSFTEGGQALSSKYLTSATASSTYLTQTNATSTYQPKITTYTLSPSGTASFSAGTLTFDLSLYDTITARNTALGSYLTTATASTTYLTQTSASSTYLTQTNATSTYQPKITTYTLSPSGTATFSAGTLTFDLSSYLTTATAGTTYLKLDGTNTMTGTLNLTTTTTDNQIVITNTATNRYASIKFYNGTQSGYIGIGCTATTGTYGANLFIETTNSIIFATGGYNTTSTPPRMILNNSGSLGINVASPSYKLDINGEARVYNGTSATNFYIGNGAGASLLNLWDISTAAWQIATGGYSLSFNNGTIGSTLTTRMIITQTGNVGIGKNNPNCKLYIDSANGNTTSTTFSLRIASGGTVSDSGAYPNLIGLGMEANGWSKGAIGWVRTGPYDVGDIVFINNNDSSGSSDASMTYERMRISSGGNVNITNSLSIGGKQIYEYLFNNLGGDYGDASSYDVSTFGCKFILGSTNEPSVVYGSQHSSYTMYMGLGGNYPASQYGCQIAIPRNKANPALSVRFKEASSWGGWSQITAGNLYGTANFTMEAWHYSTDGQQRFYFGNGNTTYIQGQGTAPIIFRNNANADIAKIDSSGNVKATNALFCLGSAGVYLTINSTNYWCIYTGNSPSGPINSLVFYHNAIGTNSYWWFNGTQTATQSEVSDKRSKYNIQDFTALETINKLKPKTFDVIDDKDVRFQYGFIAQDIEEIPELSKLVHTEPNYIANINSYGSHENNDGTCIITANDDLMDKIEVGDELKFVSENNDKDNQEFVLDATPYHNRCKRRYGIVTEIISSNQFKIDREINNFDPFLIYGKKVEDAKSLDYNSFIALNTKAIQELYKIIEEQQTVINNMQIQINSLLNK